MSRERRDVHAGGHWQVNGDAERTLIDKFKVTGYPTVGLVHKSEVVEWYGGSMDEGAFFAFLRTMHLRHPAIPEMKPNPKAKKRHDR